MDNIIEIRTGELRVAEAPITLTTGGIGSCVAVCLYSPVHKTGGLAHVMLPTPDNDGSYNDSDTRFADRAISIMVKMLENKAIIRTQLVAKIVGGANMFPDIQGRSPKVGQRNIDSVKAALTQYGIRLVAEDVGGSVGRAVSFELANGIVNIKMTI